MSFLILPPSVSNPEARIRALAASRLPQTQNFWFEDLAQIPAKLQALPFQILTDYPNEPHEFFLKGKLYKSFTPPSTSCTLNLVLNPGIYEGLLSHPGSGQSCRIAFQISVRELLWWAWTQQLLDPLQKLESLEQRYNSPLHLTVFEAAYPPEILSLQSCQWSVRSFAQSGHLKNVAASTNTFVGALLKSPVRPLSPNLELKDRRSEFSQSLFPFVDSTVSRRSAFLAQDANLVVDSSWNHGSLESQSAVVASGPSSLTSTLRVRVHTNGLNIDPKSLQVSGFYRDTYYFSLALDSKYRSSFDWLPGLDPEVYAPELVVAPSLQSGSHTILTLEALQGTLELKKHTVLKIKDLDPITSLSDLRLESGQTGTILVSPMPIIPPVGSVVALQQPTGDFPLVSTVGPQQKGKRSLDLVAQDSGVLQAGSKMVFDGDPTVYTATATTNLVAGQPATITIFPNLQLDKLTGQVGHPFRVGLRQVSDQVYEFTTTPWFVSQSLTLYCSSDLGEKQEKDVSIFPGETVVDFYLRPKRIRANILAPDFCRWNLSLSVPAGDGYSNTYSIMDGQGNANVAIDSWIVRWASDPSQTFPLTLQVSSLSSYPGSSFSNPDEALIPDRLPRTYNLSITEQTAPLPPS
jgi:hypothetical protein